MSKTKLEWFFYSSYCKFILNDDEEKTYTYENAHLMMLWRLQITHTIIGVILFGIMIVLIVKL